MKKFLQFSKPSIFVFAIGLLMIGCSEDQEDPINESTFTQAELRTILETDDVSASADSILADLYANNNSQSGKSLPDCYEASYTETGFTVTFNNCVLNGTDNANGTVTVVYGLEPGTASFTATYVDFYVGDVKLNGTRSFTIIGDPSLSAISFAVTSSMTAEFSDGSVIIENGSREVTFTFGDNLETSTYSIAGSWELQVNEDEYAVTINTALEGNLSCGYITSGTMDVNKNGLQVTVDFGDGTCDAIVTIIYPNGATEDVTIDD
ncbi:MAG: hypothetical protein HKN52_05705 [Eudoraea sp.]|nr:hypothetical protein [Eudoraea sp.]